MALTAEQRELIRKERDRAIRSRLRIVSPELWLSDVLEHRPRLEGEIAREARATGIRLDALRKAKRRLGVEGGRDTPYWSLPTPDAIEEGDGFLEPAIGAVA